MREGTDVHVCNIVKEEASVLGDPLVLDEFDDVPALKVRSDFLIDNQDDDSGDLSISSSDSDRYDDSASNNKDLYGIHGAPAGFYDLLQSDLNHHKSECNANNDGNNENIDDESDSDNEILPSLLTRDSIDSDDDSSIDDYSMDNSTDLCNSDTCDSFVQSYDLINPPDNPYGSNKEHWNQEEES